ncbi:hypothetical protein ACTXT7_007887 [Hymenolepis weldensis]
METDSAANASKRLRTPFAKITYYGQKRKSRGQGYMSISRGRKESLAEVLRTVGKGSQKNGFAVNIPVYAHDYRLGCQWTAAIITKRYGCIICDVEVGKDTWIRHHNQLRRRLAEPTTDSISGYRLVNGSVTYGSNMKSSRLQVDPSSKTYD